MEIKKNYIETLVDLGLTQSQAKIYLACLQTGTTTPKRISEITEVATPHVYPYLEELEKIGLIEKSIEKPTLIKFIPISDAIKFLINRKKQQTVSITQKAKEMLQDIRQNNGKIHTVNPRTQFIWINKKEPYIRKRIEEINNSKESIDFITSWERFPKAIRIFEDVAKKALGRNVKIRVILEKPPTEHSLSNILVGLEKNPNYQLKFMSEKPPATIAIFDRSKIIVDTCLLGDLTSNPAIWTENPCFVSILSNYFELLWK